MFFRKKIIPEAIVDIHSHVLPGVDDGAVDMEETLSMLKLAQQEGITHLFATPHYKIQHSPLDKQELSQRFQQLQAFIQEQGLTIQLFLGNEVYYFSDLKKYYQMATFFCLNQSRRLLVEFSPYEEFSRLRNAAIDIFSLGLVPVFAHIERYQCLLQDNSLVQELKDLGVEFQVNASSIIGEGGSVRKSFTRKALKEQLVDYLGTDAHHLYTRPPKIEKCVQFLYHKYDKEYVERLLYGNAFMHLNIKNN